MHSPKAPYLVAVVALALSLLLILGFAAQDGEPTDEPLAIHLSCHAVQLSQEAWAEDKADDHAPRSRIELSRIISAKFIASGRPGMSLGSLTADSQVDLTCEVRVARVCRVPGVHTVRTTGDVALRAVVAGHSREGACFETVAVDHIELPFTMARAAANEATDYYLYDPRELRRIDAPNVYKKERELTGVVVMWASDDTAATLTVTEEESPDLVAE